VFARFLQEDDGKPIVMLNLLRFEPDGGRDRYSQYLAVADPLVKRHRAEIIYVATVCPRFQQKTARPETRWRWCATRLGKAFANMVKDPDYRQEAGAMRQAALVEAVLQPISTVAE
jgi:hypothetical protein